MYSLSDVIETTWYLCSPPLKISTVSIYLIMKIKRQMLVVGHFPKFLTSIALKYGSLKNESLRYCHSKELPKKNKHNRLSWT